MKKVKFLIVIVIALFTFSMYLYNHTVLYEETGVCIEKFITSSQSGQNLFYHIIVRMEDGTSEEHLLDVTDYVNYKIGDSYIFKKYKIK